MRFLLVCKELGKFPSEVERLGITNLEFEEVMAAWEIDAELKREAIEAQRESD